LQPGAASSAGRDAPAARAALAARVDAEPIATGGRDALDELVDDALADWRPLLKPMVDPLIAEVQKAVAAGESLEAFAARLPELLDRMDSGALAESIARAAFVARLAGAADLDLTPQSGASS
jgi:phage gp29-like protein